MNKISVVLASDDAGVHVDGAALGALKLGEDLDNTIVIKQKEFNKSHDKNDLKKNLKEVNSFNEELYNKVYNELVNNNKVLTIGGDHSLAIGSVLSSVKYNKKMGIIWIDAHGDYNTFDTTITGNLHGLPLAVIDNYEKTLLNEFHNGNYIDPKNTVVVGVRDLDPKELENLKDAGVTMFTTDDVHTLGVEEVMNLAFKIASFNVDKVHVSYDLDVIDPKIACGVSIPAKDGISKQEAYDIMDEVLKHSDIINTMDLVEYNSLLDKNNETYNIAIELRNKILNNL